MSEKKKNPLNKLMNVIDRIGTTILQNLAFLVCCVPTVLAFFVYGLLDEQLGIIKLLCLILAVVTSAFVGAGWSGLYSSVRFTIRDESWFAGFKKGFKTRFLRNMVLWSFSFAVGLFFLNSIAQVINYTLEVGVMDGVDIFNLVIRGLFLLLALMFTTAMIPVNLYLPTDLNRSVNNSWYLVFRAPLRTLICTVLLWAPVALFLLALDIFVLVSLIFLAAYFAVVAVVVTILLKKPLIKLLEREREENPHFDEARAEDLED